MYPERESLYPEGITVYPEGVTLYPEGITVYPERESLYPEGKSVYSLHRVPVVRRFKAEWNKTGIGLESSYDLNTRR